MSRPEPELVFRTFRFAAEIRKFVNELPRTLSNREDSRQVIRSSGSVAANYVEAQEGTSRKEFFYRIRICRKESRESNLWLRLLDTGSESRTAAERDRLAGEADQLKRIFSAIAAKDRLDLPAQRSS